MTAQIPEILFHRSMRLDLCAEPLREYLRKLPKKRRPEFASTSTACRRGYIGTWEIQDGCLCLVALQGNLKTPKGFVDADLKTALPWVKGVLPAAWLTDRVRCPEGRLVAYVHAGYASRYERDRVFDFERGRLLSEWLVLNPPEPIIYQVDGRGCRTCVDSMCSWDVQVITDPLDGYEVTDAYRAWGKPPSTEADENDGYVIGAAYNHPPT